VDEATSSSTIIFKREKEKQERSRCTKKTRKGKKEKDKSEKRKSERCSKALHPKNCDIILKFGEARCMTMTMV